MALPEQQFSKQRWISTSISKSENWKGVLLRDFDPDTQRRIQFHPGVCAAFFDNLYTDEDDAELAWLCSPANSEKRREVKYGNNIAVLFKALYHSRAFYKLNNFWAAIARGWKANPGCIEVVASILVQARRIYRQGPGHGRPACQTAQAVDLWIDYLDSKAAADAQPTPINPALAFPTVKEFYHKMEKKMVNAGRIPRDSTLSSPPSSLPAKPSVVVGARVKKEGQGSDQHDSRNSVDRSTRKRSRSPSSSGSPTSKRFNRSVADGPRGEEATCIVPPREQDTRSQPPNRHAGPAVSSRGPVPSTDAPQTQNSSSEGKPLEAPPKLTDGFKKASQDVLAAPKSEAADVKRIATAGALIHLQRANEEIKESVVSLRSNMETLTDSMATIFDHVESVRHDVNELKKQQPQEQQQQNHSLPSQDVSNLEALLQKCAGELNSLKADFVGFKIVSDARQQKQEESQGLLISTAASSVALIQGMMSDMQTMMSTLSGLKSQPQPAPVQPPPVQLDAIKSPMEGLLAKHENKITSQVEGLLAKHESKITSQVESLLAQRDDRIRAQIDNQLSKQQNSTASQMEDIFAKQLARVHSSIDHRIVERGNDLQSRMKQDMVQFYIDKVDAKSEQRMRSQIEQDAIQSQIDKLAAELKQRVQPQIGEDIIKSYIDKTVGALEQRMHSTMEEHIQKISAEREQRAQPQIEELLALAQQGSKMQAKFEDAIARQSKVEDAISQQQAKLEKLLTQQSQTEESISEHESKTQSKMATYFREQNGRMDKLRDEMSNIKSDVALLATGAKSANAQTLREAMQFAVIDMKQHQEKVQRFYNRLTLIGGLTTTAQVADFLVKLDDTLMSARACGITTPGSR